MVWILSQNHHFYPVKGSVLKGIENKFPGGIDGEFLFLLNQELLSIH